MLALPLCSSRNPLAFNDACIRALWGAFLPAIVVFLLCLSSLPFPGKRFIKKPFQQFLTLEEAEAFSGVSPVSDSNVPHKKTPSLILITLALVEILLWVGVGIYEVTVGSSGKIFPFLIAASWIYAFVRPIINYPVVTAPTDLFWLFSFQFSGAVLLLGGAIYDQTLAPGKVAISLIFNVVVTATLLTVVVSLPLAIPSTPAVDEELERSPEDYTSLFGWITFSWIYPVVGRGTSTPLAESEVWNLSPTMQSRPVFFKFMHTQRATLLRSLLAANSLDLILDAVLTIMSVILTFTGPLFLNLILTSIEQSGEGGRRLSYLYALLAFVCSLVRSEAELYHFYYSRRAATRMRTELMVAVYDKALKRKDFSGIVDADAKADAKSAKDAKNAKKDTLDGKANTKKEDKKADEDLGPKAGAQLGKIVNLMSVDANTISSVPLQIFYLYSAPFEIAFCVTFLYQLLGWAAFSGIIFVILSIPINWILARLSVKYEKRISTARDKRTDIVNELISSIKFIKFGGGEEQWLQKANESRDIELNWLIRGRIVELGFNLTFTLLPLLISLSSFYVHVRLGNELTVATAFTALTVFNMLSTPLNIIPFMISYILQGGVALDRVAKFLKEDEVPDEVSALKSASPLSSDNTGMSGLEIQNGCFKWNELEKEVSDPPISETEPSDEDEHRFELRDISVSFPEGVLSCIVGPTASGKTALLLALLGEITALPGTRSNIPKDALRVDENGFTHSMSYAAQTPWLQYASIKDNILFGSTGYDEERYQAVLDACALRPDLEILTDGDQTEIGIRGVSLSGGQKARVALARAVYARTKYVLLDDPLSAVDSHTSRVLFDKLLCGPLLKNRTVVLVTHHVELCLPGTHYVVRMLDGRIDTQGTVQDLRSRGLLDAIKHDSAAMATAKEDPEAGASESTETKPDSSKPVAKLVEDEERAQGDVPWHIYKTYIKAASYWTWVIIAGLLVVLQLLELGQKFWIKIWGEAYLTDSFRDLVTRLSVQGSNGINPFVNVVHRKSPFGFPAAQDQPMFYVGIYGAIGVASGVVNILQDLTQYFGAVRASRLLFRRLLKTLVYSTFRWFDATPKGRILNRIGKDISSIDNTLSQTLLIFNYALIALLVAIGTVAVVFPYFLLPGLILSFMYYKLSAGYLHSGRDLRRMEANTRSPIFTGFSELLEGIVTVRAFGAEKRFLNQIHDKVDVTTRFWYIFWMLNRWLLLNFDYLGSTAVLLTSIFAIASFSSAGVAGICITSAMTFSRMSYYACRFYTSLQVELNAVERVVQYLEIPQEPPAQIDANRPPAYWPSSTSSNPLLVVEDLEVKYAPELPSVLHGISFSLHTRERVGLLGRTGSGKSTLATSILRFVEPTSGRILVDGVDICTIGLNDLRTRLTFIAQDATLFSGTVRDNLDPFGEHDDSECQDALDRVHLNSDSAHQSQRTTARSSPVAELEGEISTLSASSSITETGSSKATITLETMVSAEGANFSHGQRQLLALARALLRQSAIIILDEATSSIDFATDLKIQQTIREEFNNSLLLTIAHRIKTVIDYDRLIIMDKGTIAEFDTPHNLINKKDGIFRDMCMKSGMFDELEAAAAAKAT